MLSVGVGTTGNVHRSTGKPDLRSAYGLHAREFLLMLRHIQSARGSNVFLIGAMERVTDDYGRTENRLQMEGQRVGREIGGIVDIVITMQSIDFGDGKPIRAFVCNRLILGNIRRKIAAESSNRSRSLISAALIAKILPCGGEPSRWRGGNERHQSQRRATLMST